MEAKTVVDIATGNKAAPEFMMALLGILLLMVGDTVRRGRTISQFVGETCTTLGLFIGGWYYGLFHQFDGNFQVAIAIFSSWGLVRSGQWSITGFLKLVEILAKK